MALTKQTLELIHELLAGDMLKRLQEGTKVINKETGELETVSITAAEMNVIRQFLKDNNVERLPTDNKDDKFNALLGRMEQSIPEELRRKQ